MSCFRLPAPIYRKMTSYISNYWWGSSVDNHKIHWLKWNKLTDSKADALRETSFCRVPLAHGKTPKTYGKGFAVCRTRQPAVGKGHLCHVLFVGHMAKTLSCAFSDPRQLFRAHVAQHLCRVLYRPGTRQSPVLCRVLGHLHMANNVQGHCFEGFFAVCHGKCTRQRAQFRIVFFCRLRIWYPKHYRHFIYITISILCIQRSITGILYYPEIHRCKEILVSFIDNHK